MSYSSDLTKERILECAKAEFLAKGFVGANMREIASNANVTTGALYNHFKSKEELFYALVGPVARELRDVYALEHAKCEAMPAFVTRQSQEMLKKATVAFLDYLYDNLEIASLIFFYSNGTKYATFKDELIEIEEQSTLAMFQREGRELSDSDRFFVHVMASSGLYNTLEAIHHNLQKAEALAYMEKLQNFHYAGWKEILGRES
ncbi:TetR/AcrR family transcriptional regulator [Anaerotignum sp. MB30-C6]|uniref:TetR/AcrR family transcriptional regulator n=1 Tax=Anaerotignum sp. MB30-C6 TaxID=3070814 RepID=UPI0027DBAF59|nr:TetR/AcrR family transcriptional regulator [Anaerotignum sp. MB30-C6]WMI79902.1 TetR/AcrR family transcriptional regulator [Anaerotignum sp. MB30-C6]